VARAADGEVAWYDRGARPSFWRKTSIQKETPETRSVSSLSLLAHDVDADGDLDLLSHTPASGSVAWYANRGATGDWKRHVIDNLPGVHYQALEDLNRDGRPELVVGYEEGIVWYAVPRTAATALPANYKGDPNGRVIWARHTLARSGAGGGLHHLAFGDLDGDGDRDLCVGAAGSSKSGVAGYLAWWERPADPTLLWTKHTLRDDLPGATHLLPADVDRDGQQDLVFSRGHASGIAWLKGPRWSEENAIDADWLEGPHTLALADLDGDGDVDVAGASLDNDRTAWWENNGKGSFTRRELDIAQAGSDLRIVDLDGDGDLDLLVAGESSKNVVWFESQRR